MYEYFETHADTLRSQLEGCADTASACAAVGLFLDGMRTDYMTRQEDAVLRERAAGLMQAARAGTEALIAASEADVRLLLPSAPQKPARRGQARRWTVLIGAAGMAALAVYLLIEGMTSQSIWAGASALASGAAGLWASAQTGTVKRELPAARGTPRVNAAELMRRMDRLARTLDATLEKTEQTRLAAPTEQLKWTDAQLSAVQTLWEALSTDDGAYALKALPLLFSDLERQGLRIACYTPDAARDFEELPGLEDGETIRPALYIGARLAAPGQVARVVRPRASAVQEDIPV